MNQHTYVQHCYQRYAELDLQPGNPEDGRWEKAHYPVPDCAGGTNKVWLLHAHHQIQGVLQSIEYQRGCHWPGSPEKVLRTHWLDNWFELWDLVEAAPAGRQNQQNSPEHRAKISEGLRGKPLSDQHRQQISETLTGNSPSEATREKLRQSSTGRTHGSVARQKVKKAALARPQVTCPHCGVEGSENTMKRWHFDNCAEREGSWRWFTKQLKALH